jgi:hypothetical protein
MDRLQSSPAALEGELDWIHKDGRRIATVLTSNVEWEQCHGRHRIHCVLHDITERKAMEAAHEQDAIRLQALVTLSQMQASLLDKAHDAIFATNLQGKIDYWNKSAEDLYGWTRHEAQGRTIDEIVFPMGGSELAPARAKVLAEGEWVGEMNQVTAKCKKLLVHSRWTLVLDEADRPQRILMANTDLTEQKRLEIQFLRAQRMESLGTLASGIAHDLNNVLAPILMAVQFLSDTTKDKASRTMLATLENSAQRGANIIRQVLTFARGIEGDRNHLNPKYLVKEMAKIMEETFPKSITVKMDCPNELWSINGDATQLHQVLMNLCINARDAMPDGGLLTLTAGNTHLDEYYAHMNSEAKRGPYVAITVTDTGGGIPPHIIEKIFEPFFTTKPVGKGTGLGLATALGITKSHGGFIHVYSEVAKGAQFKVYLPACVGTSTDTPKDEVHDRLMGHGEVVLVVDDEPSIREITQATLESSGYRVLTANDGTEAIPVFIQNHHAVHLVLVDMMMPFMDGAATIRALRRIDPHVPIIAASGMMVHKHEIETSGCCVQSFLPKPFTAQELLQALAKVLTPAK